MAITAENLTTFFQLAGEIAYVIAQVLVVTFISIFRFFVPPAKKSVRGKVVLVTGAAQGLGRLLALKFGQYGAKVIVLDVNKEKNKIVAEEIQQNGGMAWAYVCDVGEENQVENVASKIFTDVGSVDILVNNAGILPGKPLLKLAGNQIQKTLRVNALSHFWTIKQFLPKMLENREGHIVAIASVAGMLGCTYLVDYCASKHAVMGLMSALREELHEEGNEESIQMTVICPSTMNTTLVQKPITRFPSFLPILDVEKVADIAFDAILRNQKLVVIPTGAHFTHKIMTLFPVEALLILLRFLRYKVEPNE